jgi:hypothetical protein
MMTKHNSVVANYTSHTEAASAVKELQHAGFDMKKLSIIGRDHHTGEARNATEATWDNLKSGCKQAYEATKDGSNQARQRVSDKIAP